MEVLEGAVESFDGTAILISHDRYLLDRLCDRILEVRDGEVRSFDGGYDDWIAAKATV
jgi:ATPase subunit of ABC transporter with duplicated ATPase domains